MVQWRRVLSFWVRFDIATVDLETGDQFLITRQERADGSAAWCYEGQLYDCLEANPKE